MCGRDANSKRSWRARVLLSAPESTEALEVRRVEWSLEGRGAMLGAQCCLQKSSSAPSAGYSPRSHVAAAFRSPSSLKRCHIHCHRQWSHGSGRRQLASLRSVCQNPKPLSPLALKPINPFPQTPRPLIPKGPNQQAPKP